MEDKKLPPWSNVRGKLNRYEKIIEISTWLVVIVIIFGVQIIPDRNVDDTKAYLLIGAIVAFALFYYLIMYKYFSRSKRLYLKDIADIVLIGSLILVLKDWGQYFYALFFLPIAAAALSLEFINALLIAVIASLFVIFEVFMGSQDLYPQDVYQGAWQIGLILLITIFCRALASQIRQEKAAKEEVLARQEVMEEENRRQKEFLSLTSHQLYTPLSMIRGFTSLLQYGTYGDMNPKQKDAVNEIYINSKRMTDLITELLSISRIQSGKIEIKKETAEIDDLIEETVDKYNQAIPKKEGLTIEYIKSDNLGPIEIDKEKIRQVIYALIDNANKYTHKGSITLDAKQENNNTIVTVKDTGIGLEKDDFDKLFQPFFRGKNILELDNKGTGLGLYISRLIIEKHGGKIWAESLGAQKGSTFTFSLPMVKSDKEIIRQRDN